MALSKFFRVAVEGATVDGREISRQMIQQMADSYNTATYTARINCEHIRGYSPDKPFNAWGSVSAVKAEEIKLSIGGKEEKRLALLAQLDVTDEAKAYNGAGQKLFSSVEVQPNFAETGKAYLVGLAFTDSPASLGTELLKFSRDDKRKENMLQIAEEAITLSFDAAPASSDIASGVMEGIKQFFAGFSKVAPPATVEPATEPNPTPATEAAAIAAFAAGFSEQFEAFGEAMRKSFSAMETRVAKIAEDQAAMQAVIEKSPQKGYTTRPLTSGGNGAQLADC